MQDKFNMKKFNISRFFGEPGAYSTSKSITFNGSNFVMEVGKNGYEYRTIDTKWYNSPRLRIFIFAIIEIIFYILTRRPLYNNWYISSLFVIIAALSLFLYTNIFNDSKNLRMNHGAEHKVINSFLNHDLENADKYSRFSEDCGGNIYSILAILVFISPIIKFPITIFFIFMIIYNNLKPLRVIAFNTVGKFIQKFTTAEPTEEILKNAKDGFKKLLYIEVEKMIKDEYI